MKAAQLREHADCGVCRRKIGHAGLPIFWTVRIERYAIDMHAVRRQDGLGAFLGSNALAAVMGPDQDLAHLAARPRLLTLCDECAQGRQLAVAALLAEVGP